MAIDVRVEKYAVPVLWLDTSDEAVPQAIRRLGFDRTGRKIRQAFKSALTGLLRQGALEYDGDMIRRRP